MTTIEARHAGEYTWDYLEAGPTVRRVRIGRADVWRQHAR